MEITGAGGSGGGSPLTVTDGITPVVNVTTLDFVSGAVVSSGGVGQANVAISGTGGGTVTNVSVVTANGFAGTVATSTTTPAITLMTSINSPILAGNGTAISAATTTGSGSTVVLATSPILVTPALGTPASGNLSNTTGFPTANLSGLGTGMATFLATPSSANLASAITDETGSGALVFANTPTLITPVIGVATGTSLALGGGTVLATTNQTGTGSLVLATSPTLTTAVLGSSTATTQTPSDNSTKVATTAYVDAAVLGQNFKEAALVATTANLVGIYAAGVFTYTATGTDTIDGVALALGNRVLVKNQTTTFQNGIYTVTTAGALGIAGVLTRSSDANTSGEFKTGDSIFVTSGTANTSTTWAYTGVDSPTIGTDAITYAQSAGQGTVTAGNGITVTGLSVAIDTSVTVDKTTAQTLTNKTLTTPIIANISNTGTVTLPTATDTLVARATTDTLTNKRMQPRTASSTTASTLTPDLSSANVYYRTTQTVTLTINAPIGTPVIGETIAIYVDSAGAQTLTMDATYIAFGAAFPASTTAGKTLMITAQYNGTNWKTLWANQI